MASPPHAPRRPHVISAHGDDREDPWFWLREREDPEPRGSEQEIRREREQSDRHLRDDGDDDAGDRRPPAIGAERPRGAEGDPRDDRGHDRRDRT